ncbi:hypothetical protein CDAR_532161 [Caerostris darwini]|uniref:Uncharacterized protein n=1 Tax=Caerostris darwini TaxID=1538125 RepID=A0AAV4PKS3_9ARAC|nr:hypothetical protein CDAR_532161 [Caerostris darwini]
MVKSFHWDQDGSGGLKSQFWVCLLQLRWHNFAILSSSISVLGRKKEKRNFNPRGVFLKLWWHNFSILSSSISAMRIVMWRSVVVHADFSFPPFPPSHWGGTTSPYYLHPS